MIFLYLFNAVICHHYLNIVVILTIIVILMQNNASIDYYALHLKINPGCRKRARVGKKQKKINKKMKSLCYQRQKKSTKEFRMRGPTLLILTIMTFYSINAQKTFFKEIEIQSLGAQSPSTATVLETGKKGYFTISDGVFENYDPTSSSLPFTAQGPYYNHIYRYDLDGVKVRSKVVLDGSLLLDMASSFNPNTNSEYLYVLAGASRALNVTGAVPTIIKLKADDNANFGDKEWSKDYLVDFFSDEMAHNYTYPQSVIPYKSNYAQDSDEGCLVLSILSDYNLIGEQQFGASQNYLMITRLDKDGAIVWKRFINTSVNFELKGLSKTRMVQNDNGIYIMHNYSTNPNDPGSTFSFITKLDRTNGNLIQQLKVSTQNNFPALYDICTNGTNILACGTIKESTSDLNGVVVKLDKDLSSSNFWNFKLSNSDNKETFFRIVNTRGNEYALGGYFQLNSSPLLTVSYAKLLDNGSTYTLNAHSYLVPGTFTVSPGGLNLVDMESDLGCGVIYFVNNSLEIPNSIQDVNTLIRVHFDNFSCNNNNLTDIQSSPCEINEELFPIYYGNLRSIEHEVTYANPADDVYYTRCETCSTEFQSEIELSIPGKGIVSNGCLGDKLVAPDCYVYYEWYKNGLLYATTEDNEFVPTIADAYTVRAYYSQTCYNFSKVVNIRPNPIPDFTFSDNCISALASVFTNTTPIFPSITTTVWDFGDGTTSSSSTNASHTYTAPGTYNVKLKKTSNYGCVGETIKPINIYSLPVVNLDELYQLSNYNPNMAVCLTNVSNWTGSATANLGQTMSTWSWFFNDPNQTGTILGQTQSFTFANAGSHNVDLIVTTNRGCIGSVTKIYNVYKPTGDFTQDKVCEGDNITLTAAYNTSYGSISSYEWLKSSVTQSTSNPYTISSMIAGTHSYQLYVWDSYGCKSSQTKNVIVYNKPTVSFTNTTSCSNAVMSFTGTGSSSGTTITAWNWSFNDGGTGAVQNPTHSYLAGGTYNPTLTVTDGRGCMNSFSKPVTVISSPGVPVITSSPSTHNPCVGDVLTLSASSYTIGHSLLWSANYYPSISGATSSTVSYTAPNANTTETIGLKVTDPVTGCYTFASNYSLVTKVLDVTIASNSTTNNLCPGATIQLNGLASIPVQNYQWQKSTNSGTTWSNVGTNNQFYTATTSGWYRYEASNNYGCTKFSSVMVINNAGALSITNNLSPVDQLYPSLTPAILTINTTNAPIYTQIQWYRNDVPVVSGTTASIPLTVPGDYYVIAGGCSLEKSNIDVVNYESSNPSWSSAYLMGLTCSSCSTSISSPPGGGFKINGDIVLTGSANVTIEATINFQSCSRIIVNAGSTLTITNNSKLSSTSQWKGIYVDNGGTLIINNNSDISNAVVGVFSKDGGKVNIQNSTFGRNVSHIVFDNFNQVIPANISNNTFGHVVDASTSLTCTGYTQYTTLSVPRGNQIYINGSASAQAITFNTNTAWLTRKYSGSNNVWLNATNNQNLTLAANIIKGFYNTGIKMQSCNTAGIFGNQLTALFEGDYVYSCPCIPRGTGISLKNTSQATVTTNTMKRWNYGMEYYENLTTTPLTDVSNNKFIDGKYGLVVAPVADPIGNANAVANKAQWSNSIRLTIGCNLFDGNEIGLVGSGSLLNQGSISLSSGNRFRNVSVLNSYHSILWNWNLNWNNFNVTPSNDDFPYSANPTYQLQIDGDLRDQSTTANIPATGGSNGCTSSLVRSKQQQQTSIAATTRSIPKMYPNPASNIITLDNLKGNSQINVYSTDGKLIANWESSEEKAIFSLDLFPNGLYLLYVNDENGIAAFRLMKVSNN